MSLRSDTWLVLRFGDRRRRRLPSVSEHECDSDALHVMIHKNGSERAGDALSELPTAGQSARGDGAILRYVIFCKVTGQSWWSRLWSNPIPLQPHPVVWPVCLFRIGSFASWREPMPRGRSRNQFARVESLCRARPAASVTLLSRARMRDLSPECRRAWFWSV